VSSAPAKIVLVANPHSGHGKGTAALAAAANALRGRGVEVEELTTRGPGHAVALARRAVEEGATHLAAVGGDGTLHEVLNGAMLAQPEAPPVLAAVPVGGGNDYARGLGLPSDPARAALLLLDGRVRQVDVGRLEGLNHDPREPFAGRACWFINNVGLAYMGEANAARERTRFLPGKLSYVAAGLLAIAGFRADQFEVTVDGLTVAGRFLIVHVGLGPYCGAGVELTTEARVDAGRFAVFVLGERSRLQAALEWGRIAEGRLTDDCCTLQGGRARVRGPRGFVVHVDGEIRFAPGGVVDATILPGAVRIAAPT
jgi:YegS/Rv2252/BmrU family lipid kinase